MRRGRISVAVALLLGLMGAPASAGEHIEVQDDVLQGDSLKIVVHDCVSGDTWTAHIYLRLRTRHAGGDTIARTHKAANNRGRDVIRMDIGANRFPRGLYRAEVDCEHHFGDGTEGIFFTERETFRVLEPD